MNVQLDRQIRSQLRRAFAETPPVANYSPLVVMWRFPHLEPMNRSWTFLSSSRHSDGMLRTAAWDRFGENEPMRITDVLLDQNELVEAFEVFGSFEVLGDQRGGIYDGPLYGRELYDENTGDVVDAMEWIHEDTFRAFGNRLSESLINKLEWKLILSATAVRKRGAC